METRSPPLPLAGFETTIAQPSQRLKCSQTAAAEGAVLRRVSEKLAPRLQPKSRAQWSEFIETRTGSHSRSAPLLGSWAFTAFASRSNRVNNVDVKRTSWFGWLLCGSTILAAAITLIICLGSLGPPRPLARLKLADGRILQVEGATFGTNHVIGVRSVLVDRLGPWLPAALRDRLAPRRPRSEINLDTPGLVVWVNAIDSKSGKQVDCQGIRVEFVGAAGDVYGEETHSWFGARNFWRVGHIFHAFPRTERQLTLRVTPWRMHQSSLAAILNPHVCTRADWQGQALPQRQRAGDLEIVLSGLALRTNGAPENYWQSASRYWEPQWKLLQAGKPATGWDAPEWMAEDASGNRGKYLGVHEPVLRFSASFYPRVTNESTVAVVAKLPAVPVQSLQSNIFWGLRANFGSNNLEVLGLFPAGTYVFSQGVYQSNAPVSMGPVMGGAPSGWVGQSQRVTPLRVQNWDGHYTDKPVVYIRAGNLELDQRWGVRLRDERGRLWAATPEPQGVREGIRPFLIDLPPEVQTAVVEVVVLRPIKAKFYMDTRHMADR
jgi:hypothetical protein